MFDNVRGIAAAAETYFKNTKIRRCSREKQKRRGHQNLEHGDGRAGVDFFHLGESRGQRLVGYQRAGDANALVEAHKMWAGIDMHAPPGCLGHRAKESAGAAFAVGTRNMQDRRQSTFGIAELPQ